MLQQFSGNQTTVVGARSAPVLRVTLVPTPEYRNADATSVATADAGVPERNAYANANGVVHLGENCCNMLWLIVDT